MCRQKSRVDKDRCTERQALRVCFKDRSRRAVALQRIKDLPESSVPPLCQVYLFQKISDAAVAIPPVEYLIGS